MEREKERKNKIAPLSSYRVLLFEKYLFTRRRNFSFDPGASIVPPLELRRRWVCSTRGTFSFIFWNAREKNFLK